MKNMVLILLLLIVLACNPSLTGQIETEVTPAEQPPQATSTQPESPLTEIDEPEETATAKVAQAEQPAQATSLQAEASSETGESETSIFGESEAASEPATPDKWALWVDGPHLRGANIWQAVVIPELDGLEFKGPGPVGPPYSQEDFDRLAAMGANYVSISGPGLFTETPPYSVDPGIQAHLDNLLAMIAKADMFATIGFRTGPGRSEFTLCCGGDPYFEGYFNDTMWQDQAAQDAWVEMWRYTAQRYGNNPIVAGYKLMVEPNAAGVLLDIYDPEEFYPDYAGTLYDWNQLYPRLVAGIRQVDPNTPILAGGMSWSGVAWLSYLQPTDDPRTVYVVHQYEPQEQYTHQELSPTNSYPGEFDTDWDGEDDQFDRAWLDDLLATVDEFVAAYSVPVAIDEYGLNRWVPGGAEFMDDQMDLFEQRGMNYALWEWQTSWEPFAEEVHAMNFRLGPDPGNRVEVTSSELMDVINRYWARNIIRPSNFNREARVTTSTPATTDETRPDGALHLTDVSNWFYMINVNLEPEMVNRITASEYDMVVLDFIPSEANNTDYPMAEVIDQLHNAPHAKLVLAYIDIGQAEEYRTYWQPGWGIGNPEWIVAVDPDGWEGNFPVAYWHDEWRDIWLGDQGYLQAILEAGFDGVYLDWVEAYSDENVVAIAKQDGVDPRQEMIWWVGDIAEFGQTRQPDFIIIAQNAAELAENDDYLDTIDAIAQEQVWFDGEADNNPPGDCPLPRTEAEINTAAYRESLSPACRAQYDNFPDSTLHVSSEEYLRYLTMAHDQGEIIFTVDYALELDNVAWVYETSRALGFVPFVSSRALDRYVAPSPEMDNGTGIITD
jgi:cysteinyl-tRNA synthetase